MIKLFLENHKQASNTFEFVGAQQQAIGLLQDESQAYSTFKYREAHGLQKRVIDYIFFTPKTIEMVGFLKLPKMEDLPPNGLPSSNWPSDHLSLVAEFCFKWLPREKIKIDIFDTFVWMASKLDIYGDDVVERVKCFYSVQLQCLVFGNICKPNMFWENAQEAKQFKQKKKETKHFLFWTILRRCNSLENVLHSTFKTSLHHSWTHDWKLLLTYSLN